MKKFYRRSISGLLALLICFTTILSSGVTAFAASSSGETAKSYSVAFPRDGDANLDTSGTWGHDELHYMNGWTSGEKTWMTTLHTIGDFNGPVCYCIEPGVPRLLERTYARYGEDYWKDYPSECNSTIDADTIKTLLGRIMQYGYQGNLSLGWRSQNDADADKLALMMATQVLVWETVVGERDANFNHVDPGGADAVKSVYRTSHPLYSRFSAYYDSIEASVKKHTIVPSFMARSTDKAQMVELSWDGSRYAITLTDTNGVLGDYTFSSEQTGITFVTSGNTLTITAETAPTETVTISATKNNTRKGVVVWSDGHYGPDGTMQDVVTYSATISDPVKAYLNLKVSYGSTKIVKTSEDGKVEGISFTITGNGVNKTVVTGAGGVIQIDNLAPGVYTVTEQSYDKYEPQEVRRVTVVSGQVATVNFNTLNWKKGKRTHIVIDEFHVVFENEQSGIFFNSAWRQFRKRNGYPTAITQNVEYLLDSVQASTMLSNSEFVVMLNQAFSDRAKLSKLLNISDEQMSYVTNADAGCGLIKYGSALVPFINRFPKDTELYRLMTTRPGEGVFGSGNAS